MQNCKFQISNFILSLCILLCAPWVITSFAQQSDEIEFTIDTASSIIPLPKIFKPNIDLSGRGFNSELSWPQSVAAREVLDTWQKDIGFGGLYRLQYNLWEIQALAKDKELEDKLLSNYESIIKTISDNGGIVILDIFGTPAGLGKVLDKKSPPFDFRAFKEIAKSHIRRLSCDKKYNIWYEVWTAPDSDDFFLGRKQEYLNLYRAVAEAVEELSGETKIYIPLGAPAVSWWFQNLDANTVVSPERSLIYDLIKFCAHYRLPLNFISWHSYSTDPKIDQEITGYNKTAVQLIRDWLSYFNLERNIPLIVDEWNYDSRINILPQRQEQSYICASYIPARIKKMYEAGLDYQLYFALEDFQNNPEGVLRNVGIFWFKQDAAKYKGGPKAVYNVFRMLATLRNNLYILPKNNDEFCGLLATKSDDYLALLIYNYIDPDIAQNYISRNIAGLNDAERKILLRMFKSDAWDKIIHQQTDVSSLRVRGKLKNMLKKAQELNAQAEKFKGINRNIKISIRGLKEKYLYQRYAVDNSCAVNCDFKPVEEKEIDAAGLYQEVLSLSPYSVNLVVLKKKPPEPKTPAGTDSEQKIENLSQ